MAMAGRSTGARPVMPRLRFKGRAAGRLCVTASTVPRTTQYSSGNTERVLGRYRGGTAVGVGGRGDPSEIPPFGIEKFRGGRCASAGSQKPTCTA